MMAASLSGRWLFLIFLVICIVQDILDQSVDIRVFIGMFAAELIWYIHFALTGHSVQMIPLLEGIGIGAAIFGLSVLTQGAVGTGDAFFFSLCGLYAGFIPTLSVLSLSLFISGIFSLIIIVYGFFQNKSMRKKSIPFLPFTAIPAIMIFLLQNGGLLGGSI